MNSLDTSTTVTLSDEQATENRIRAVLGLGADSASIRRPDHDRGRPDFAPGGDIPVAASGVRRAPEAPDSLRQRLAAVEETLKAERSKRVAAERALAEAQTKIQQLQARLAHNEIAAVEALAVERKAILSARAPLEGLATSGPYEPAEKPLGLKKKRGRPRLESKQAMMSEPESEPVQWWLPNYRTLARRKPTAKRPAIDGEP